VIPDEAGVPHEPGAFLFTYYHNDTRTDRECQSRVEIVIDVQAILLSLGPKAASRKSGKATALRGALKVRRIGQPKILSETVKERPVPDGCVKVPS
jgi:hypothetical protein